MTRLAVGAVASRILEKMGVVNTMQRLEKEFRVRNRHCGRLVFVHGIGEIPNK